MKVSWMVVPLALGAGGPTWAMGSFGDGSTNQQLFCNTDAISSDFPSATQVRYRARGFCSMKEAKQNKPAGTSTFDDYNNAKELYRFSWTSTGSYNVTTKATQETIEAPPPRIDEPSPPGRPYGRFTMDTICDVDPWLQITVPRCAPAKTTFAGNLPPDVQRTLGYGSAPFTSNMSFAMRDLLRAAQRREDERRAALARTTPTLTEARATPGATSLSTPTAPATLGKRKLPDASTQVSMPTGGAGSATAPQVNIPDPSKVGTPVVPGDSSGLLNSPTALTRPADGVQVTTDVPTQRGSTTAAGTAAAASSAAPAAPAAPPPSGALAAAAAAPRIVLPAVESRVSAGQLRVQVVPVSAAPPREAQVEFKWLSPIPGQVAPPPERNPVQPAWTLPMQHLAQGAVVPPAVGPTKSGRWQVRVRALGEPSAAWSAPVVFDFVAAPDLAQAGIGPPQQAKASERARQALQQRGLNPQPLPPRDAELQRRGLNPQPLPPKESGAPRSAFDRQQQP
jgi:hypothetical protein